MNNLRYGFGYDGWIDRRGTFSRVRGLDGRKDSFVGYTDVRVIDVFHLLVG